MIVDILYKLRNKKDGTFYKGSEWGRMKFTRQGKVFNYKHHIMSSMSPKNGGGRLPDGVEYTDLEVVTLTVAVADVETLPENPFDK